jgi:hypothetical protein
MIDPHSSSFRFPAWAAPESQNFRMQSRIGVSEIGKLIEHDREARMALGRPGQVVQHAQPVAYCRQELIGTQHSSDFGLECLEIERRGDSSRLIQDAGPLLGGFADQRGLPDAPTAVNDRQRRARNGEFRTQQGNLFAASDEHGSGR